MHNTWKFIGEEKHNIYKCITVHKYQVIGSGGCQCYGDCDCYKERGVVKGIVEKYSHSLSRYPNGNVKKFETLKQCVDSAKSKNLI